MTEEIKQECSGSTSNASTALPSYPQSSAHKVYPNCQNEPSLASIPSGSSNQSPEQTTIGEDMVNEPSKPGNRPLEETIGETVR